MKNNKLLNCPSSPKRSHSLGFQIFGFIFSGNKNISEAIDAETSSALTCEKNKFRNCVAHSYAACFAALNEFRCHTNRVSNSTLRRKAAFTLLVKALRSNPLTALLRSRLSGFSHTKFRNCVAHSYAFTLAEILSVLAILGIVASITVPSTIQNIEKQQTLARFKAAYSMLVNLTENARAEHGFPVTGVSDRNPTLFNTYFRPYLNIAKDCGVPNRSIEYKKDEEGNFILDAKGNKIIDKIVLKNPDDINNRCFAGPAAGIYNLDGKPFENNSSYGDYYNVILKNGMALGVRGKNGFGGITILVDVDGPKKGYSKLGQDTFYFTWATPGQLECHDVACVPHQTEVPELIPGGLYWFGKPVYYHESPINRCRKGASSANGLPNGSTCSVDIIRNGYKFPSNYPWAYARKKPDGFVPVK